MHVILAQAGKAVNNTANDPLIWDLSLNSCRGPVSDVCLLLQTVARLPSE